MIRNMVLMSLFCGVLLLIHAYNQGMATRAVESALHSLVYVTVPNVTVGKEIARFDALSQLP